MSDYIDRRLAILAIAKDMRDIALWDGEYYAEKDIDGWMDSARDVLEEVPSADVVKVVRCKDCEYKFSDECPMYFEEDIEWEEDGYIERDTIYHDYSKDDGFCDRGERRIDGEEIH